MTDADDDPIDDFEGDTDAFSTLESDDDELGEFVSSLEDDGVSGLAAGLDSDLAAHLEDITSGTGSKRRTSVRARDREPGHVGMSESPAYEPAEFETYELEVDHDKANVLLKTIYQRLQQRMDQHYEVEELILGLPQYKVLQPWSWAEHDQDLVVTLPVSEITLVPGPMIHPVVDNHVLWHEYLEEQSSDGGET